MFKKKWYHGAKGAKKKEKLEEDDGGDFGMEFIGGEFGSDSANRVLPPPVHKGPNSVTFQLSGPRSFSIVGRNKTIRDVLKKMVGSRFDEESGAYEFHLERREGVKNDLSGLGYDVNDIPTEAIKCMEAAIRRSARFEDVDLSLMPQLLLDTLLPFQRIGVEFAIQRGGKALICDDMGLGKTIQGIAVASYYMSEWPVLILAQSSLKRVWSNEFEKWIPSVKGHIRVVESGAELTAMGKPSQITIMAYDLAAKMSDLLRKLNFKVMIADESHMLKSVSAQRTRELVPLLRSAQRTILLSGTPALSRPAELFPQLLSLHSSIWPTMKGFGLRYCNAHKGLRGWDYTGNSNLIELNALLTHTVMIRRLKESVLSDLPPKVRKIIEIEKDGTLAMDPIQHAPSNEDSLSQRLQALSEQDVVNESFDQDDPAVSSSSKKIHPQAKPKTTKDEPDRNPFRDNDNEDILAMYREASVSKQEGVKKYVRQLIAEENSVSFAANSSASFGTSPFDVENDSSFTDSTSAPSKKLDSTVASRGRKFLLFAHHLPMLDAIESELKLRRIRYMRIDGGTSTKDRALYVKQFQEEDSMRAAVLSLTCASTGLTLTAASLVVFAELYWNPGTLIQAEDRVHRLGQTAPFVELRYLFCKGTVDDHLWPLIGKKLGVVGSAINGAKDRMALDGAKKPVSKSKITSILPKRQASLELDLNDGADDVVSLDARGVPKKEVKKHASKKATPKEEMNPEGKVIIDGGGDNTKKEKSSKPKIPSMVQTEITSFLQARKDATPSIRPHMDPIVIDDSQESVTPVYFAIEHSRKRALVCEEEEEEDGFGAPSPKRPMISLDFTSVHTPMKSKDDGEISAVLEAQTEPPARSKTLEWAKTRLSFLSPAPPLRLGFKK